MSADGAGTVSVVAVDDRSGSVQAGDPVDAARWGELARASLVHEGVEGDAELTLSFVDADRIAELHAAHLGGEGPTDVLAFPLDPDDDALAPLRLLGDVVVCPGVAARQARARGVDVDDEIALLVVHGVLHVLGHRHAEPDETARMQARERDLLDRFHRADAGAAS